MNAAAKNPRYLGGGLEPHYTVLRMAKETILDTGQPRGVCVGGGAEEEGTGARTIVVMTTPRKRRGRPEREGGGDFKSQPSTHERLPLLKGPAH